MTRRSRRGPTAFARRVLNILRRIPAGTATTYGDVARLAGRPGAARAVGNIMRTADEPGLPYHRVVAAGGRVGGYGSAPQLKQALLAAEGLTIRRERIVNFTRHRWTGRRLDAATRRSSAPRSFRPASPRGTK
jgi:O-6-methylguanine DNA methyltransferase